MNQLVARSEHRHRPEPGPERVGQYFPTLILPGELNTRATGQDFVLAVFHECRPAEADADIKRQIVDAAEEVAIRSAIGRCGSPITRSACAAPRAGRKISNCAPALSRIAGRFD